MREFVRACVMVVAAWALPVVAQVTDGAREVVMGAREAMNELESLRFDVSYVVDGTGVLAQAGREVRAKVVAAKTDQGWIRRAEGTEAAIPFLSIPEQPLLAMKVAGDAQWLDPDNKVLVKAYGRLASRRLPGTLGFIAPDEMFEEEPYAGLLRSLKVELDAPAEFAGVVCDVVLAQGRSQGVPRKWYFGRDDAILRGWSQEISGEGLGGSAVTTVTFSNLRTNDAIDPGLFDLEPPAGYSVSERGRRPEAQAARDDRDADQPGAAGPTLTSSRVIGTEVGDIAPGFSITDTRGEVITRESLEGSGAIVYFWSSWNPRCARFNEELGALLEDLGEDAPTVVAMAIKERDAKAPESAADEFGFRVSVGDQDVAAAYGVRRVPAVFVLDDEGRITLAESGHEPGETVEKVRAALAGSR